MEDGIQVYAHRHYGTRNNNDETEPPWEKRVLREQAIRNKSQPVGLHGIEKNL